MEYQLSQLCDSPELNSSGVVGAAQWKLALRWLGSAWQLLKVCTEETSKEELRLYGEGLRSIVGSSEGGLMEWEDSNFWTMDLQEVKVSWEVRNGWHLLQMRKAAAGKVKGTQLTANKAGLKVHPSPLSSLVFPAIIHCLWGSMLQGINKVFLTRLQMVRYIAIPDKWEGALYTLCT